MSDFSYLQKINLNTFTLVLLIFFSMSACDSCEPVEPPIDAGALDITDLKDSGQPANDGGDKEDAGSNDAGKNLCDEDTEGFGDECAANQGDPLCGHFICCQDGIPGCDGTQLLFCYDQGPNDCGACGELDEAEGKIGEGCGEFGCGEVVCSEEGTETICMGDHPRNVCGGCADLMTEALPGDSCSACMTGTETCTRDQDAMVCWQGRSDNNQCGSCEACVLASAEMDERFGGGYIRIGTKAYIEDIGDGQIILFFDPLVEGPGISGLPSARISLVSGEDPFDRNNPQLALFPSFAQDQQGVVADPVRQFSIPNAIDITAFDHVIVYENLLLRTVISVGLLEFNTIEN